MTERDVDRAVSTTVAYVLTLSIATIAISGLVLASGGFVQDQRQQTAREELRVVGQRLASDIETASRLAAADSDASEVSIERSFPTDAAGASYTIEVVPGSPAVLVLRAPGASVTVRVNVRVQSPLTLVGGTVNGGTVVVQGVDTDADGYVDELEVVNG